MENRPLAERMRPQKAADIIGQKQLLGEGMPLANMLRNKTLASMILWGPPGVGKTTLARILAKESERGIYAISAVTAGVKDVREILEKAKSQHLFQQRAPVLFIDEIHRFNKSQQDSLLHAVETGQIVLIGATTENPSFEINSALLSRCQVFVLSTLDKAELQLLLERAIREDVVLKKKNIDLKETEALIRYGLGDARKTLNNLETAVIHLPDGEQVITNEFVEDIVRNEAVHYDKDGEMHYDIISAFIKSVRGSHTQAALYWLARMLQAGEDVKFIARRLLILATEDIGLANPTALVMANACFDAVNKLGMPEARIPLSQCTIYLCTSPKSNAAYMAINKAMETARQHPNIAVPLHLRNAPTKLMKDLNYGKDYLYPHDYPGNFVQQEYMPPEISNLILYVPGNNEREKAMERNTPSP